jgi:serine/threonine protein kinase
VDDLEVEDELGRGQYGQVNKMKHKLTGKIMAVKVTPNPFILEYA